MSAPKILIVVPVYGAFEYAARAVRTAVEKTRTLDPYVVIVDDASPRWQTGDDGYCNLMHTVRDLNQFSHAFDHIGIGDPPKGGDRVFVVRFDQNGGLTRSWNEGLRAARHLDFDFCCVTNSDVLFTDGWDHEVWHALAFGGYDLVGPVSNAPGTETRQYVGRYSVVYDKTRAEADRQKVQDELRAAHRGRTVQTNVNGFCMVARTATWWANAYDPTHVFCPMNLVNSKGEPNPTPLMTLNEYEFQRRFNGKVGCCPGSYVFHYRAVTRGDAHKKGDWARIGGNG